jgi:hypothetical protein
MRRASGCLAPSDLGAIQSGLEWPGVIFVEEIGYGAGVMLRK